MKKLFLFIGCLIMLSGCYYDTGESFNSDAINRTAHNLPPSVEVIVNNSEYPTRQGSYCWINGNTTECVDMASPFEMLTEDDKIKVTLGETVSLKIGRIPAEQELSIESIDFQQSQFVQLDSTTFKAPSERGTYYYLYFARWDDKGTRTGGDSSYGFMIEVE